MLEYKEEKEKTLELELIKIAVESYAKEKMFEEGTICQKEIAWYLKTIFSFEIGVEEISKNSLRILVRVGSEIKILDFEINKI